MIIPARLRSSRFPNKVLAAETGRPLVQHVVDQVKKCKRVGEIIVAADDQKIVDALLPFDTKCVLTEVNHESGTDRIAEVARGLKSDIILNVQGDEPEIPPATVDDLIDLMTETKCEMATAATPFPARADVNDRNLVKVVLDLNDRAMYFSRSPIPCGRDSVAQHFLHLGLYCYARDFLLKYASWKPTPLELTEKLEQLRALEHRVEIVVLRVTRVAHGIDTPQQYADFVKRFSMDRTGLR